jgi:hypothetical protein
MPDKRCDRGASCGRVASRSGLCDEHWIELLRMARLQFDWALHPHVTQHSLVRAASNSKASACLTPPAWRVTARLNFSRQEECNRALLT